MRRLSTMYLLLKIFKSITFNKPYSFVKYFCSFTFSPANLMRLQPSLQAVIRPKSGIEFYDLSLLSKWEERGSSRCGDAMVAKRFDANDIVCSFWRVFRIMRQKRNDWKKMNIFF